MGSILVFQIEFGKSKARDSILNHHVFWNLYLKGRILERSLFRRLWTLVIKLMAIVKFKPALTRHGWNRCHLFHPTTIFCGAAFGLFVRSIQIIDFGNKNHQNHASEYVWRQIRLTWRSIQDISIQESINQSIEVRVRVRVSLGVSVPILNRF